MRATTALWMIGISNLAFGIHFLLWKIAAHNRRCQVGIDPFASASRKFGFLLFCILTVVEVVAIVRGYIKRRLEGTHSSNCVIGASGRRDVLPILDGGRASELAAPSLTPGSRLTGQVPSQYPHGPLGAL